MAEVVSCERYKSPDGALELLVERYDDGDTALGFAGFSWHTHPSVIAGEYGFDESIAVERLLDEIMHDRLIILIMKKNGRAIDAWVSRKPVPPDRWMQPDEERLLRYWTKPFDD